MKEFKIAKVINEDIIIINGGTNDGLKEGVRLMVYSVGGEIIDPDSGDSLGKLELPKGFFKVKHSQEKISTLVSENSSTQMPGTSRFSNMFFQLKPNDLLKGMIEVGDFVKIVG